MRWPWGNKAAADVPADGQPKPSAQEVLNRIDALDLNMIKLKLAHAMGKGWSLRKTDAIERKYKRFLYLSWKYRGKTMVPTEEVDEFWHYHILDTQKYPKDCMRLFGYVIHHFPYLGVRGKKDEEDLHNAFAETCAIYEREFGEPYTEPAIQPVRYAACGEFDGNPDRV